MKTWRKRLAAGLLTLVLGVSLVPGAFAPRPMTVRARNWPH